MPDQHLCLDPDCLQIGAELAAAELRELIRRYDPSRDASQATTIPELLGELELAMAARAELDREADRRWAELVGERSCT